jgi:hypothetical protein
MAILIIYILFTYLRIYDLFNDAVNISDDLADIWWLADNELGKI